MAHPLLRVEGRRASGLIYATAVNIVDQRGLPNVGRWPLRLRARVGDSTAARVLDRTTFRASVARGYRLGPTSFADML